MNEPTPGTVSREYTCRVCRQFKTLTMPADGYQRWQDGQYIQDALPSLSADDRELMISGVCGPCFDAMFAEEEEDEETAARLPDETGKGDS